MAFDIEQIRRSLGMPGLRTIEVAPAPQPPAVLPQPVRAPVAAQAPMQAPQAAPRPRGLLGGFFGPEGRDARSRLAIGLEGLAMNPNQALIGQLQQGIESRETSAQKNATIEWLLLRGRDDLAAAMEGGLPAADALRIAMEPAAQPEIREVDGRLLSVSPDGTVRELYGSAPTPDPQSAIAKLEADRRSGLINDEQYKAGLQALAPTGTSISVGPDGQLQFTQGVGVGGTGAPTVGQVYNPNEIQSVIGMIDQIATDPNLASVVGQKALLVGGGNKISDMNLTQRIAYGQEGLGLIERIGQLQSNAWLSARQMLKGGGAITDYESQKAEAAVARLERPKSKEEFTQALKDLRDAITDGEAKLRAQQGGALAPGGGMPSDDALLNMYGG